MAAEHERRRRRDGQRGGPELEDIETSEAALSQAYDKVWAELVTREAWVLMARRKAGHRRGGLHREVLTLRFAEGLPPREIAAKLGVADVKEVYRIVETGRQQFKTAMITVLAGYHPDANQSQLEEKSAELLELL